jgi:hypothetical protein
MAFIDLKYTFDFWKNFLASLFSKKGDGSAVPPTDVTPKKVAVLDTVVTPTPAEPIKSENTFTIFDPELIITDEEFTNVNSMSEKEIQDFLTLKGSFLKDYSINDKLTSYWIYKHCTDNGLNPKVLMTHIQKEQGTITTKTFPKNKRRLDYFCGVGAYDPPRGDDPKWAGVDKQILGAVTVSMKRFKQAQALKFPYAYITDKPELRKINIKNAATRSLYFYTPFVGDKTVIIGKNKYESPFANNLFWAIYAKWFGNKK